MHCAKKCGLFLLGILLLLVLGLGIAANFLAGWLSEGDKPGKADAILVLAGDYSRPFQAADLYRQGLAPKIYISVPIREKQLRLLDETGVSVPRQEEIFRQVLLKKGVPANAIELFGKDSISTAAEAQAARTLFAKGTPRLLIVTSPYHLRRTRMIFTDALPNAEIRAIATSYERLPQYWWNDQDAARNVLLELPKILFYRLGGRF